MKILALTAVCAALATALALAAGLGALGGTSAAPLDADALGGLQGAPLRVAPTPGERGQGDAAESVANDAAEAPDGVPEQLSAAVVAAAATTLVGETTSGSAAPSPPQGSVVPRPNHPPSVEEPTEVEQLGDGSFRLSFRLLSDFEYRLPDPTQPEQNVDQIPTRVREFHGKSVLLQGYMVPLSSEGGQVTSFYLARDVFGCCFGDMPKINEMVEVRMKDGVGVPMASGIPVIVGGRLEVGEEKDEFGYVNSIYRLEAESVNERW